LWQLPRESRVFAKLQPATQWGWNEIFQNKIVWLLETIVWQNATPSEKGKRAAHKRLAPQLYRPDFMPDEKKEALKKDLVSADVDTIKELLARPRVKGKKA